MGFWDTDYGSPIPWMASVEEGIWVEFEIAVPSITPIESDVPFGKGYDAKAEVMGKVMEALADFRNVGEKGVADGEHLIPFWACAAIQETLLPMKKTKAKFTEMRYKRTTKLVKGVENSVAEFVIVGDS